MQKEKKDILIKQIIIVNDSLKLTIVSSIILGSIIFLQTLREFSFGFNTIWFLVFLIALSFRIYLFAIHKKFLPNRQNLNTWVKLTFANTFVSSLVYGIAGFSTYFMNNTTSITIIYIILAGVSAGAVTAYGPVRKLSLTFIIPVISPLVLVNIVHFDLDHLILACTSALFAFIIYSTSKNLHSTIRNTLEQKILIRDLNEEKIRMEELSKLKSDFFATMSHEIRTPLNGIIGLVDIMNDSPLNSEQKDYLSTIKKSSDDLLNVINDVLDLSKIESGKLDIIPKETNLKNFANRMVALFNKKAQEKNIRLSLKIDNQVPEWIFVDEHRLSQIITNLISNGIKFTDSGFVRLNISTINTNDNVAKIRFEVEDSGIGIEKDKQELVFNKYDQIASSDNYTITQMGTGLGLSIVKKLVVLMNGQIELESTPGIGSKFIVEIEVPVIKELINKEETIQHFNYNLNILLVDDRDINLKVSELMLKKLNCEVTIAKNGQEAIDVYKNTTTKFDLILMDIQMPIMDGITATKILQNSFPDLPPVYGLSAQIESNLHNSAKELGFDFYLTKPLTTDALRQSLDRLRNSKN